MTPAVHAHALTKRFGAFTALDAVDLMVAPGAIHAIVGENGAGKTSLMRVIYGALAPDSGELTVLGEPARFRNSAQAIAAGVSMVSQHYAVIPELTNLQNLMLGAEPGPWISETAARARAQALADRMGFRFDWSAPSADLGPAGSQKLEILKLLWRESRVMILDEPTAMLSPTDAEALFASLRNLAAEGATVLLVTHRLPEVMAYCDHVTVLRAGRTVADGPVRDTSAAELAERIVGHSLATPRWSPPRQTGDPVLRVTGLRVRGDRGDTAVTDASFEVRSGEVVGIAGVDGSGQRELLEAISGVRPAVGALDAGGITPAARIRAGLRMIPEDRAAQGAIENASLTENAMLGLQRTSRVANRGWIDHRAAEAWASRVADRFETRRRSLKQPMRTLSGGNQQRLVAARALESDPRLILAFQPARGLDIAATAEVYAALRAQCAAGSGALVVAFELDEILTYCDRIFVMSRGRLRESPTRDRQAIGQLMVDAA